MKRLAAVIISIVFIFTACDRHAVENKVFNTAETKEWTTGYYAGAAVGVIAAVGITAAVICKCRCNKTEPEIEKTYKIIAELNRETELTVEEIYYKLANIIDIPFELKIRHGTLTHCQKYVLRMDDPHAYMSDIFISDSEHNKNRKLASIEGRIYDISLRGVLSIPGGEIVPSPYLAELMTIKTERIDTLEITSEQQEDTKFLNKLIILEKKQVT